MHTKLFVFVFFIVLSCCHTTWSQIEIRSIKAPEIKNVLDSRFGIEQTDWFDAIMDIIPGVGSSKAVITEQNLKPYMMPSRKISDEHLLTSYSVSACLEYYINFDHNYKVNLSPDYIALNLQNGEQPIDLEATFEFLNQNGTVSAAILPYGATAISSAVFATQKYTIKNYLHLFRHHTKGKQKIFETRKALMRGHPVLIELIVDEDFKNIKEKLYWSPKNANAKFTQKQALVVVGFDEDLKAFEVSGSYGREWGTNGYLLIDYSDFEKYAENGYVLVP